MGSGIAKEAASSGSTCAREDSYTTCTNSCSIVAGQTVSWSAEDTNKIYFYDAPSERVKPEHIFLNNFGETPFVIDGVTYKSVEHFYQVRFFCENMGNLKIG